MIDDFVEGAAFGLALGLGKGFLAARNIDVEVKSKTLEGLARID
jgi:hypothetical protein